MIPSGNPPAIVICMSILNKILLTKVLITIYYCKQGLHARSHANVSHSEIVSSTLRDVPYKPFPPSCGMLVD